MRTLTFCLTFSWLLTRTIEAQDVSPQRDSLAGISMSRIVPTSLHSAAPARSVGADVTTITAEEIAASGALALSELLEARVPGLSVMRQGGTGAEASRVRIRGPVSHLFNTAPLYVVDGVPMRLAEESRGIGSAVKTSSRDDLLPEQIERIDVLRGPAGAMLYGPGAAAGVIVITTKRATPGPWRVRTRVEGGVVDDHGDYPTSYRMTGTNPSTGQPTTRCLIEDQVQGRCDPQRLNQFNPLRQASPFRTGQTISANASAVGVLGITGIAAAIGAGGQRLRGVTPDDEVTRSAWHLDLSRAIGSHVSIGVSNTYNRAWASLPVRGNVGSADNVILSGLFGSGADDSDHGYGFGLPTFDGTAQRAEYVGNSGYLSWHPTSQFKITTSGGRDRVSEREHRFDGPLSSVPNTDESFRARHVAGSIGAAAEWTTDVRRDVRLTSILGYDERRSRIEASDSVTRPGPLVSSSHARSWDRYRGVALQERSAWSDEVFVNLGVAWNADGFVKELLRTPFYGVDAAWVLPDRFFGINGLRLRGARAIAGADPSLTLDAISEGGLPVIVPRSDAEHERTQQTELGADAPIGHGTLSLTYQHSLTRHVFMLVPIPNVGGFFPVPSGVATMRNAGVELSLSSPLIQTRALRWDAVANLGIVMSKVLSTGNAPPVVRTNTRFQAGYAPGAYWATPVTYRDLNDDGLIDASELRLSNQQQFVGESSPTLAASLHSSLSTGPWTLGMLLDHRGGFKRLNRNELERCRFEECRGVQDPTAPLRDQARAASANTDGALFIEDASFVRLKELSLRWSGGRTRGLLGRFAMSLIARDLAIWTRYSGLDPEIAEPTFDPAQEFAQSPLPRRISLRVELLPPVP
jgi:TonB-dependent starch-binding outer membrane protein SusC